MFFIMSEKLRNPADIARSERTRAAIASIIALFTALESGCATTGQNTESGIPDTAQNTETKAPEENARPEWVNGPQVFEKDGYVYAVGSQKIGSFRGMGLASKVAELKAHSALCRYINGENVSVDTIDGNRLETRLSQCTIAGARNCNSYIDIEDNDNGAATMYVLLELKK